MKNCLVTKLNVTVNNPNCDKLNCINIFVDKNAKNNVMAITLNPTGNIFSISGDGYRSTEQGEVYPTPGESLKVYNWFYGTGDYKLHLDRNITYIDAVGPSNDANDCIVKLSDFFDITVLVRLELESMMLEGDLMEIGKINNALEYLVFQKDSVYGSSSSKLEDVLANYQRADGDLEFIFGNRSRNYMGNNLTFNEITIPVERWIATYSSGTITVKRKSDSEVLGTYNGTTWSYPSNQGTS